MKRIIAVLAATIILSLSGCLAAFGLFEQDDRTAKNGVTEISETQSTENQNDENTYTDADNQTPLKDVSLPDIPEQDITLPNIPELEQNPEQDIKTEIENPDENKKETIPLHQGSETNSITDGTTSNEDDADYYLQYLSFNPINDGTEYEVRLRSAVSDVKEIVIPEYYNGKPVTEIAERGFDECETLETISMGGIKKIGEYAFHWCKNLNSIVWSPALEYIDSYAFNFCSGLVELTFPPNLKYIGDGAFLDCRNINSIIFSECLEYIGRNAFSFCAEKELVFPPSLKYIGRHAFASNQNVEKLVFSIGLEYIGELAFAFCHGLKNVVLPSSLKYLGDLAFFKCDNIKELTLPLNLEYVGYLVCTNTWVDGIHDWLDKINGKS